MRFNLYKFIHTTIRGQMGNLIIQAGRSDYFDEEDTKTLYASICRLKDFINGHALREDMIIHPTLKEKSFPGIKELEANHVSIAKILKDISREIGIICEQNNILEKNDLDEKGYQFYLNLSNFIASYFDHMNFEERVIMPFLWSHYSDDELSDINVNIQKALTTEEIIKTIPDIYPFIDIHESIKIIKMLKVLYSSHFDNILNEIKKSIRDDAYTTLIINLN